MYLIQQSLVTNEVDPPWRAVFKHPLYCSMKKKRKKKNKNGRKRWESLHTQVKVQQKVNTTGQNVFIIDVDLGQKPPEHNNEQDVRKYVFKVFYFLY